MSEFENQLNKDLQKIIMNFKSKNEFADIRNLYLNNFDKIKSLIKKFGHQQSIEDISNIDQALKARISSNLLLLKEINRGISLNIITANDLI